VTRDDMEIVSALRAAVADKVGKERFDLWFGASSRFQWNGDKLTVLVPNPFFQQWLRSSFCEQIECACLETLGTRPVLEFCVDASLDRSRAAGAAAHQVDARSGNGHSGPAETEGDAMSDGRSSGAGRRRFADFESFVVGPSNRLAHAAAEAVTCRPGELSPLVVYGPTGVGKTHLLEGTWTGLRKRHPRLTVVYLSAEQFTTSFLQALRGSGLPSFRRKYRGLDVLILDDLQFFSGKRATQIELQYTVDTLLREGRQLVFAADRAPADLVDLGPELVSRLASGVVCRVERPDYETRRGILGQMARRFEVNLPDDVVHYVASNLSSHARELSGALCRLRATSEAWQAPVTLSMAEEALADLVRSAYRTVRLADIQKAMCDAFGLEPRVLQSGGKAKSASHPRMLAMWLARKLTRNALGEISSYFGRRSHTTVISAQKRVDRWLAEGGSIELADRKWKVDEAVEQVERRLRAG
jgi:chromosomal replication initiator protein